MRLLMSSATFSLCRQRASCCFTNSRLFAFKVNPGGKVGGPTPRIRKGLVRQLLESFERLKMPTAMQLFRKDQLSPAYHIIVYRGDNNRFAIGAAALVSIFTVLGGFASKIYDMWAISKYGMQEIDPYDWMQSDWVSHFLLGSLVMMALMLHTIGSRYILRIYYNQRKKEFIGVTLNTLNILRVKKFVCKPGEPEPAMIHQGVDWFLGNVKKPEDLDKIHDTNINADASFNVRKEGFKSVEHEGDEG